MRKKLTIALIVACTIATAACGSKGVEENAQETIQENVEVIENNTETDKSAEADLTETDKTTEIGDRESITNEEGIPWDEMAPINIGIFPAEIKGAVNGDTVFYPNIFFTAEYIISEAICFGNLNDMAYSVFAYIESHMRPVEDGGRLYYEQVGDYIICTSVTGLDIEIKDTVNSYMIHISPYIWGADENLTNEYLLKNCEYIKEQIEEMLNNESTTETAEAGTGSMKECDMIPCGKYNLDGTKWALVGPYDDDDSGDCMITFSREDAANNDYWYSDYYDIDSTGDTYTATNTYIGGSVTITFTDDGMDISSGVGELEEFCGHYSLEASGF